MTTTNTTRPETPIPAAGVRHARIDTVLGSLTLVATGEALTGLYFPDHAHPPRAATLGARIPAESDPLLGSAAAQLREYLAGDRRHFDLPLEARGDAFAERVWGLLREIPYGQTTTYGALAERLGNPRLAQHVGRTVGRNPISILIPCHRVVGADGSLTGYAGGLWRKRRLLEVEEPAEAAGARLF